MSDLKLKVISFDHAKITFFAFMYSACLVFIMPIDGSIIDRTNYINYAGSSEVILFRYLSEGVVAVIFNEPVWLALNIGLGYFFDPEQVVAIIIFVFSFLASYLVLKSDYRYAVPLLLVLFMPQFIGKYVVHLRQGVAISIFIAGWFSVSRPKKWTLFFLCPFVHASFFFVLIVYLLDCILRKLKLCVDVRSLLTIVLGFFLGSFLSVVASSFGARQAGGDDISTISASGLGFLFWFGILFIFVMQGPRFCKKNSFALLGLIFYLTIYFLTGFSGRIFESFFIFVMISLMYLSGWRKIAFYFAMVFYLAFGWSSRIGQPWMGWGLV